MEKREHGELLRWEHLSLEDQHVIAAFAAVEDDIEAGRISAEEAPKKLAAARTTIDRLRTGLGDIGALIAEQRSKLARKRYDKRVAAEEAAAAAEAATAAAQAEPPAPPEPAPPRKAPAAPPPPGAPILN